MNELTRKLTMAQPATYEIIVLGELGTNWADWTDQITMTCESLGKGPAATTLTGTLDQAALHGLLRRMYAQGLPLISVTWVESQEDSK